MRMKLSKDFLPKLIEPSGEGNLTEFSSVKSNSQLLEFSNDYSFIVRLTGKFTIVHALIFSAIQIKN